MKEIIEKLIKLSDEELQAATIDVMMDKEDANDMVIYWATRLKTLKEVQELMNDVENQTIH